MSALLDTFLFASGGATDPDYASVSLLLHCDGTNGSTTFTDNSPSPRTVTANGNAQVTTSTKRFGTGGLALDGSGDYLSVPANALFNFGTGDFTIEWSVNFNATGSQYMMDYASVNLSCIQINPGSGNVWVFSQGSFCINTGSTAFNTGTWYDMALVRSGGTWTIYRDATQYAQTTGESSRTFGGSSDNLYWGIAGNIGVPSNATFDEIRITKGVARTISALTAAYPDS